MRVSRRLAAYSKPLGLLLVIGLLFHFSTTDTSTNKVNTSFWSLFINSGFYQPKSSKVKRTNKHKSKDKANIEIGEQNEFPGFTGTIIGRGIDENVPLPVYREVGSPLGNYEKSLDEIMAGATGTGDFGKTPVTSSDTEAIKRSIKGYWAIFC